MLAFLFLWSVWAADPVKVIEGTCDKLPSVAPEYQLIFPRAEREKIESTDLYNPNQGYPYNNCRAIMGDTATIKEGRCTRITKLCTYTFALDSVGQGPIHHLPHSATGIVGSNKSETIEADCATPPATPAKSILISVTTNERTEVSKQFNNSYGYPYNDCVTLMGEKAVIENGKCLRRDKVCTFAYQRPTAANDQRTPSNTNTTTPTQTAPESGR